MDRRLYWPQAWVTEAGYAERRRRCGLPAEIAFTTKPLLGWEMRHAVRQASPLRCRWVSCNEAFGRGTDVLERIAGLGLWYFAEVPHDPQIWQQARSLDFPPGRAKAAPRRASASRKANPAHHGRTAGGRVAYTTRALADNEGRE